MLVFGRHLQGDSMDYEIPVWINRTLLPWNLLGWIFISVIMPRRALAVKVGSSDNPVLCMTSAIRSELYGWQHFCFYSHALRASQHQPILACTNLLFATVLVKVYNNNNYYYYYAYPFLAAMIFHSQVQCNHQLDPLCHEHLHQPVLVPWYDHPLTCSNCSLESQLKLHEF